MLRPAREAWLGTLVPGSVRVTQLEPGRLLIDRSEAVISSFRFVSCSWNVGYNGSSELMPGKTVVGVIADPSTDARWFGERVRPDDIVQANTAMDITTYGSSKMLYVATDTSKLETNDGRRVHRNPENARRLRWYLAEAIRISRSGNNKSNDLIRHGIEMTLLTLLELCLSENGTFSESGTLTRRVAAVRKCVEYVREHIDENPTLQDLCAASGLRIRSLINAFHAVIGMSPMTYLRVQRLNEVHEALLEHDVNETRVIDVAADWGFWHMGHFTESYRAMFGESPSETLRRRPRGEHRSLMSRGRILVHRPGADGGQRWRPALPLGGRH